MGTPDTEYLKLVLARNVLPEVDELKVKMLVDHFSELAREWAGKYYDNLLVMGSNAQDTAIKRENDMDLDLLISLRPELTKSLKDTYKSLYKFLEEKGYEPFARNISMRVFKNGVAVDLVPALQHEDDANFHSVYSRRLRTWNQSNVQKHIDLIKNSGITDAIKLGKIWAKVNHVDFPSFYLALVAVEALRGKEHLQLDEQMNEFFAYLITTFLDKEIEDPSNSNDWISEELNRAGRKKVVEAAEKALTASSWQEVFNDVRSTTRRPLSIAFDVDGTLLTEDENENIISENVNKLKEFIRRNYLVIVWSHAGIEHAQQAVVKLRLKKAIVVEKGSVAVDIAYDNNSAEHHGKVNIIV